MENHFSKYLKQNGWRELSMMTFQNIESPCFEIFFDTSNQIELYSNNERVDEAYIITEPELIEFLIRNNLSDLA